MPSDDCVFATHHVETRRASKLSVHSVNKPSTLPASFHQERNLLYHSRRSGQHSTKQLREERHTSISCSTAHQIMAPSHPLRRLSTGSLSSLHRSQDRHHASPSGLDFLSPAFQALNDEAAMLEKNVQQLNELHDALGTFNESFAGWLYALKMNAFCVEWPQVSRCFAFAQGMFADGRRRTRSLSPDCKHWVSICRASNLGPS